MKTKLFNRAAKKRLKKNLRKRRFVNYDKAENILLLFESNEKSDALIKNTMKTLKNNKKNVIAWGFSNTKSIIENSTDEIKIFNKKNISIFQKPNKDVLKQVKSFKFDLLIDLSLNASIPLMYLSLFAEAAMKISTKITDLQLFDFILDVKHKNQENSNTEKAINEQFIFDEIIFYLKSIQTRD